MRNVGKFSGRLVGAGFVALLYAPLASLAATAPPLGTASSFAVLSATPDVTNTGPTIVTGDLGVSPAAAVVGFPPGSVIGTIHAGDATAASAQAANTTAYGVLAGEACNTTFGVPTDLTGMTLVPGVYCFASSAANTGLLKLDAQGNANAVWVFNITSTLITGSGSTVQMINGGQDCNVFWRVGSSATLGTTTTFVGNILALTSITLQTGATLSGRALAQTGEVTLASNTVSVCSLALPPPAGVPTLAKGFAPVSIVSGGVSTLTITLSNPNAIATPITTPLVDTLPTGVVVATPPNASNTCGGVVTAVAGASTVTLTGGAIPPGTCTVKVDVTSSTAGAQLNTLAAGALQTGNGNNVAPALATLTVIPLAPSGPPTLGKGFIPALIPPGSVSVLTITLSNPGPGVATLNVPLVDVLPTGLVIAPTPNASTTCTGSGSVGAAPGGSTVTLPTTRTIPAPVGTTPGLCTVSVNVTASSSGGSLVNTLPVDALQTNNGNNTAPAVASATAAGSASASIPTLSEWAMIMLAALLVLVGVTRIRRRAM